jgi:hypothetical protein
MNLTQLARLTGLAFAMYGTLGLAAVITPGAPAFPGIDTFTVRDQLTGNPIVINVPITPAIVASVNPAAAKQSAIVAAALAAGIPAKDVFTNGGDVKLLGYAPVGGVIRSGEFAVLAYGTSFSDPNGPTLATLAYGFEPDYTALAGLNATGGMASYSAGFSFTDPTDGTVTLSSLLSFSQLNPPTVGGLLTAEYDTFEAQLLAQAPSLAGILSLDLADELIQIQFPSTAFDGSVTTNVTDVSLVESQSIVGAPEPSGVVLLPAGIMVWWWRQRKRVDSYL